MCHKNPDALCHKNRVLFYSCQDKTRKNKKPTWLRQYSQIVTSNVIFFFLSKQNVIVFFLSKQNVILFFLSKQKCPLFKCSIFSETPPHIRKLHYTITTTLLSPLAITRRSGDQNHDSTPVSRSNLSGTGPYKPRPSVRQASYYHWCRGYLRHLPLSPPPHDQSLRRSKQPDHLRTVLQRLRRRLQTR